MLQNFQYILLFLVLPFLLRGSVFAGFPANKASKIYYIDPNGNDLSGDGSKENPWASLSFASLAARSGSTIHVNAGNYTDDHVCLVARGVNIEGEGEVSCIRTNYIQKDRTYGYISMRENRHKVKKRKSDHQ